MINYNEIKLYEEVKLIDNKIFIIEIIFGVLLALKCSILVPFQSQFQYLWW